MSSLFSVSSLTGKSSYDPHKKSPLNRSSLDISSQGVKNFISGMVTPNFQRKATHSTSSNSLRSDSIESINKIDTAKVLKSFRAQICILCTQSDFVLLERILYLVVFIVV